MATYFLFGEMHGTKECPKEFLKFVKENKIKKVALEFQKDYQFEIKEFLLNKRKINNLTFFKDKEKSHDGRASESVKNLILNLKKEKIKIHLVDQEAKSGNERDKFMAKNLSKIVGRVAFLCGNVHAMKKPLQLDENDNLYTKYPGGKVKTCGYFLSKYNQVVSLKVHAINGGSFYNYSVQSYQKDKILSKKYSISSLPKVIQSPEEIFDYLHLINKFSYSK